MVRHGAGSYPVLVGAGAFGQVRPLLDASHPSRQVIVIADANVAAALPSPVPGAWQLTFPAGEAQKTRAEWGRLTDELLSRRIGRDALLVAFGGGVTSDLAGFVAATYLRGIPWLAVPTSTLAMIDASVGGKTGVDTPLGKNLVGAFHPPIAVCCDPTVLRTLPDRHYREGLAEAVKHALILDAEYGRWIAGQQQALARRDLDVLTALIERSVRLKAAVVEADEHERGERAILNAGHTIAHALEQVSGYALPHGEAVAIGLVLETRLGEAMGVTAPGTSDRAAAWLRAAGLPVVPPRELSRAAILDAMQGDKKNRGGSVHAALLAEPGRIARNGDAWTHPLDVSLLGALLGGG
jgi:3-dehydroquinate synthase